MTISVSTLQTYRC